jgi:hypothetical protein
MIQSVLEAAKSVPSTYQGSAGLNISTVKNLENYTFTPRYSAILFISHTSLRTETTSFALYRFTAANCSEQTVDIVNQPD